MTDPDREAFEAWLYVHRNERWSTAVLAWEAWKAGHDPMWQAALAHARAQPQGERVLLKRPDDDSLWVQTNCATYAAQKAGWQFAWATIERIPAGKEG